MHKVYSSLESRLPAREKRGTGDEAKFTAALLNIRSLSCSTIIIYTGSVQCEVLRQC